MSNNPLRRIPSVNEVLESPSLKSLVDKVSHNVVVTEVRTFLDTLRHDLQQKASDFNVPNVGELAERIAKWIITDQAPPLRPVINATGILLHTGLGRSPLAPSALDELRLVAMGYASVEVDLETGERSQRVRAVDRLLRELTGAEAALVVNNNAGATLLTLAALANNHEVIVSRGHLVEIGGSYRLPDVMEASGTVLREVGTTNKTHLRDYANAIGEQTAALLRVHPSNYVISGFTAQPTLKDLVELGHKHHLPVIDDIGSGALIDFSRFGLDEPNTADSLAEGADIVLFSGDKLLGGPQCGIILGREHLIERITKHPLTRALRVDKTTLAALAATLRLYRSPETAMEAIPLLQLLSTSTENLKNRAERLAIQLKEVEGIASAEAVQDSSYLGGGSVPTQELPTWCVALTSSEERVDVLARKLRTGKIAVFGRIRQDQLLLDLRAVFAHQDMEILDAVQAMAATLTADADETPPVVESS